MNTPRGASPRDPTDGQGGDHPAAPFATAIPGEPPYWHRPLDAVQVERHLRLIEAAEKVHGVRLT